MLDAETKGRIDSARDILVGKVPDPKSQVEQITIALIYKFMDDMDRQSEELGGKTTFFAGEFKKYRWANLLDKRLGGHERLLLYAEGIEKMNENKNIPQLFRDIFKGVFLPYRDPETLNLFLKEINGFSYDHSERLGDAYEYLLSVLGTQGDAGQFRTPRHIIDFIIAVVDPQKHETILDPACGTAGFLISAFKHILNLGSRIDDLKQESSTNPQSKINNPQSPSIRNPKSTIHNQLTPDERARLMTNFRGYDIAPDMVRLSRVNMYLHGFPNPVIHEYDALTSEERWDERCDVIMANPPFMTPKGGIRPHNRFSIKANRSEVLFVDYIAEHLNPGGRAGIIVPEGIIFQSQNAYKALRRMLVENYLWAVVSLPAGVFNPYSGVKTSILFLDRNLVKRVDEVLFVKVENDGFDLGAQRRPIEGSDLTEALRAIANFRLLISDRKGIADCGLPIADLKDWNSVNHQSEIRNLQCVAVKKSRILESGDVNLSGDRYRAAAVRSNGRWPMVKLGEICQNTKDSVDPQREIGEVLYVGLENIESNTGRLIGCAQSDYESIKSQKLRFVPRDVLYGKLRPNLNKLWLADRNGICSTDIMVLRCDESRVMPEFLAHLLKQPSFNAKVVQGIAGAQLPRVKFSHFADLQTPIPPLDVQRQIVAELDGYRKIIEGARQVIANYKPAIKMDPKWPIKSLAEIASLEYGLTASARDTGDARFIRITDITQDGRLCESGEKFINLNKEARPYLLKQNDVLVARTGATYGKTLLFDSDETAVFASYLIRIRFNGAVLPGYYWAFAQTDAYWEQAKSLVTGGGQPQFNGNALKSVSIPIPPLATQREIVADIEAERTLVEANRKLVEIFEKKIHARLNEIWDCGS